MRIATLSVVVGTEACNARCPFCIAQMTLEGDCPKAAPPVNWRDFEKAMKLAVLSGATTMLLTGKGEPTLYPEQITGFLHHNHDRLPISELQTNGLRIASGKLDDQLREWYTEGLTTIALSVVHYQNEPNRTIYCPHKPSYPDLGMTIDKIHSFGLSVRLSAIGVKGMLDTKAEFARFLQFAREHRVEQVTIRPITIAADPRDKAVAEWSRRHVPDMTEVNGWVREYGTLILRLSHGAEVYDLEGQNVCLSDCLTLSPDIDHLRQMIFFSDGRVGYDWQYAGATLF